MDQAEGLRNKIKQNIIKPQRPVARVIAVTSGKGGVGKSNTSINLAISLKKLGQRVIILDADFGLANIEIMFGTVPKYNLSDLIYKGKTMRDIITWGPGDVGFISGGSGIACMANLSHDYLNYIIHNLAELDNIADFVIVDTGAGISESVLEFLVASGEVILVTTQEPTSITDSYSLLKSLCAHRGFSKEATQVKVLTNRVDSEEEGASLFRKLDSVVSGYLALPLSHLGSIPQDDKISKAVLGQMPVCLQNPGAKSAIAFENIANVLLYGEDAKKVKKRGMAAFFTSIVTKKWN